MVVVGTLIAIVVITHTHTLYNSDFFSLSLSDLARANTPFLELFNSLNITERRSHSPVSPFCRALLYSVSSFLEFLLPRYIRESHISSSTPLPNPRTSVDPSYKCAQFLAPKDRPDSGRITANK